MVPDIEIEFAGRAIETFVNNWVAVVKAERTNWQVETHSNADVGIQARSAKVISSWVYEAEIAKDCEPYARDNRECHFESSIAQRAAANWIVKFIYRPDFAIVEATEVVRAAEVESIEDGHVVAIAPRIDDCQFALEEEDNIPWEEEIF